jgi:hypothetical protein
MIYLILAWLALVSVALWRLYTRLGGPSLTEVVSQSVAKPLRAIQGRPIIVLPKPDADLNLEAQIQAMADKGRDFPLERL